MQTNRRWLVLSAGVLLVVGGVIVGVLGSRYSYSDSSDEQHALAGASELPAPDGDRAMRDLLAASTTGKLQPVSGMRAEIWTARDFLMKNELFHVVFFALKRLNENGQIAKCRGCFPVLAAVTYRRAANRWELSARDFEITELGKYGELPPVERMAGMSLGTNPAFMIVDRWEGHAGVSDSAHLIAYRNGWRTLGTVPVGEDNTKTIDCEFDRLCHAWRGALRVLSPGSGEFPDLVVERVASVSEHSKQVSSPPRYVTYEFNGARYVERGKVLATNEIQASARQWYSPDLSFTRCNRSRTPADRIQMIQDYGKQAKVVDLPNGAVEVAEQSNSLEEQVWTYYPSEEACTSALPRSQPIPSKYR